MKLKFVHLDPVRFSESLPSKGIHSGEVHIWQHIPTAGDPFVAFAPDLLSADELDRSMKYHFERDRKIYLSGHVFIRKVLAHYTAVAPSEVQLTPVVNRKPVMLNAPFPIQFNIAHCGERIIIAVGFKLDVGIDVEEIADGFDTDGFAEANYHPEEIAAMRLLKDPRQTDYFYTIWTRKEAWLKLTGEGTNEKLRTMDFSGNNSDYQLEDFGFDYVSMISWKDSEGYIATLAVPNDYGSLHFFNSEDLN